NARTGNHRGRFAVVDIDLHKIGLAVLRPNTVRPGFFGRHAVGDDALAVARPLGTAAKISVLGNPLQARPVRPDDVNVDNVQALPSPFRWWKSAVAIRREGDPLAVGRPSGPEIPSMARCQRLCLVRGRVEDPKISGSRGALSDEQNFFTVGGKGGWVVIRGIVRQAIETRSARVNAIQIGRAG